MSEFERINRLPTYVFQEVNDLKAKLRHKGKDIIDSVSYTHLRAHET